MNERLFTALTLVGQFIQQELTNSLTEQGHVASGKLSTTIKQDVSTFGTGLQLEVSFEDYGVHVDSGRKIGETRVPVGVLVKWVIEKGLESGNKEAVSAAFAIREAIFKEGIPTKNARKKGKRTGWFVDVIDDPKLQQRIEKEAEEALISDVELFYDNLVTQTRKLFE